jgi:hypothetical protein
MYGTRLAHIFWVCPLTHAFCHRTDWYESEATPTHSQSCRRTTAILVAAKGRKPILLFRHRTVAVWPLLYKLASTSRIVRLFCEGARLGRVRLRLPSSGALVSSTSSFSRTAAELPPADPSRSLHRCPAFGGPAFLGLHPFGPMCHVAFKRNTRGNLRDLIISSSKRADIPNIGALLSSCPCTLFFYYR